MVGSECKRVFWQLTISGVSYRGVGRRACAFGDKTAAIAPVYPQGGETHLSEFILLTPGQKVEPTGCSCLFIINFFFFFLRNFECFNCRHRLLEGVGWPSLCWHSCPSPWRLTWEGRISFTVETVCENIDARVWRAPAAPQCGAATLPTGITHRGHVWALRFSANSAPASLVHNTNENNIITEE